MLDIPGPSRLRRLAALSGVVLLAGLLAGCGNGVGSVQEPTGTSPAPGSVAAAPGAGAPTLESPPPTSGPAGGGTGGSGSGPTGSAGVATLPDLVGRGLQDAQDAAQAAGFALLSSHDALGRGRHQIFDRDWKVCFQSPAPGRRAKADDVDLGAVKTGETCPRTDAGAVPVATAGAAMPDLRGRSLAVAVDLLGPGASVTWRDSSGQDRPVIVPSDWQVCTQNPAAGAAYHGVKITLGAVKFGEHC